MEMILPQLLWNVCNVSKEEEDQHEYLGSVLGPAVGPRLHDCLGLLTQKTSNIWKEPHNAGM